VADEILVAAIQVEQDPRRGTTGRERLGTEAKANASAANASVTPVSLRQGRKPNRRQHHGMGLAGESVGSSAVGLPPCPARRRGLDPASGASSAAPR